MFGKTSIEEDKYPILLKKIPDPPKVLFDKGTWDPEIFKTCLAVVGSREVTSYGKKVISHIFSTLSKNITVVSGFMTGVDAEVHKEAIKLGLRTIAVMPCGIENIYPRHQESLYEDIVSTGLVMSEYDGYLKPETWMYPRRNRIVAGLSQVTLVIECGLESGSLITANLANSYGREVFVVPGSIFSKYTEGNISLNNSFAKGINSGCQINKFLNMDSIKDSNLEYNDNPLLYNLNSTPSH